MGTGPWPQPPTEAEQLQALMATANGESFNLLFSFLFSFIMFSPDDCIPQRSLCVGGCWRDFTLRFLLEGISPGSLTGRLCPHQCFHVHSVLRKLLFHTVSTSTHRKTHMCMFVLYTRITCAVFNHKQKAKIIIKSSYIIMTYC